MTDPDWTERQLDHLVTQVDRIVADVSDIKEKYAEKYGDIQTRVSVLEMRANGVDLRHRTADETVTSRNLTLIGAIVGSLLLGGSSLILHFI